MALKKSDLYSSLWKSCDELRGGMDASQYKDYILTLLFVKYVSDKAKADPNSLIDVPQGGSFDDMLAAQGRQGDRRQDQQDHRQARRGQRPAKRHRPGRLQRRGEARQGQGDAGPPLQAGHDLQRPRLPRLSRAEGDDLLGDAYEYLMRHFATESGKSKGQFYTPAEVSRILAKVVGIGPHTRQDQTVYDPTCGSGSLLLKAAAEAPRGITIYGQEKDNATWALSKMNMILHGNEDADIARATRSPARSSPTATSCRPSTSPSRTRRSRSSRGATAWRTTTAASSSAGPPRRTATTPSCCTSLKSLKSTGKAAVILPHGVLFRGNAEATIRRQLLKRGYIKGDHRPAGQPLLRHRHPGLHRRARQGEAQARDRRLHDRRLQGLHEGRPEEPASQPGHPQDRRRLQQADRDRALLAHGAADRDRRRRNDYNLNIPRYIDSSEPEDIQDLHAHLHGGIPERDLDALAGYWDAFPSLRSTALQAEPARLQRPRDRAARRAAGDPRLDRVPELRSRRPRASVATGSTRTATRSQRSNADTQPNDLIAEARRRPARRFKPCRCSTSTTSTSSS